ncbi:MAG: cytochrome c3 family protein [Ignavibacteria bacterium]|nr:cytochrome c3 family protein [Ignavibacteria bacterium]
MTQRQVIQVSTVFFLLAGFHARGSAEEDQCFVCHSLLEDRPSVLYQSDVHRRSGISCSGCHGGDSSSDDMEQAMSEQSGFRSIPAGDEISAVCARCHSDPDAMKPFGANLPTDQFSLIRGSVHGGGSVKGGESLIQCNTCHGAHGIVRVKDKRSPVHPLNVVATCAGCHSNPAYMRTYNPSLPVDQREKYRTSVHGEKNASGDAKAAECVSCHGGHEILRAEDVRSSVYPTNVPGTCATCHGNSDYMAEYPIPTDQLETYSGSVHGQALLGKHDLAAPACNDCHGNHAATPPGIESISNVCGTCHALNADLFSKSPHKAAFDEMGLPECETCHGNHGIVAATDQLIGVSEDAVCSQCHAEDLNPAGYQFAMHISSLIDSLETEEARGTALVDDAENKGMEVGDALFRLRDVRQARFETRTIIHSFNQEECTAVFDKGFAAASFVSGEATRAIDEYYFRRIGFGISTVIITILAIALYLTIRRIERRQKEMLHT